MNILERAVKSNEESVRLSTELYKAASPIFSPCWMRNAHCIKMRIY